MSFAAPFSSRVAALNEIRRAQISAITNECAEAVAVRINRRADAAFVGQALSRAHQLGSVPGQIANFAFGQLVLVGNRFAFTLWAMRFRRTCER